jgi:hypothetical protein
MSNWQSQSSSAKQSPFGSQDSGSQLDLRATGGIALIALGAALFGLGMFHGLANGSCSTTGYAANYGPVPHCGKGVGWWMLMLLTGLAVIGAGTALSATSRTIAAALLFAAIGVSSIATALAAGNQHLLFGGSVMTGKIFAGVFGVCFVIGGAIWGISGRGTAARAGASARLASLFASGLGVGVAFAIAAGVGGAVGSSAPTGHEQVAGGNLAAAASRPAAEQTKIAVKQADAAIGTATASAGIATKLAACVTSAGTNTRRIQACEAKYVP